MTSGNSRNRIKTYKVENLWESLQQILGALREYEEIALLSATHACYLYIMGIPNKIVHALSVLHWEIKQNVTS